MARGCGKRKFEQFHKLPIELRLNIWNQAIASGGRIIKANWELSSSENVHIPTYHLTGGLVPGILHACRESRFEALQKYSRVHVHRPLKGDNLHRFEQIFVNFYVDTIYAVKVPETFGFLSWLRNVTIDANDRHGERSKVVHHLAFPGTMIRTLVSRGETPISLRSDKTSLAYPLCMDHLSLETIAVVLDNSKFKDEKKPHKYTFGVPQFPTNWGAGGPFGDYRIVDQVYELTRDFFTDSFRGCKADEKKFRKFRESYPDWVEPTFPIYTNSKAKKPS